MRAHDGRSPLRYTEDILRDAAGWPLTRRRTCRRPHWRVRAAQPGGGMLMRQRTSALGRLMLAGLFAVAPRLFVSIAVHGLAVSTHHGLYSRQLPPVDVAVQHRVQPPKPVATHTRVDPVRHTRMMS